MGSSTESKRNYYREIKLRDMSPYLLKSLLWFIKRFVYLVSIFKAIMAPDLYNVIIAHRLNNPISDLGCIMKEAHWKAGNQESNTRCNKDLLDITYNLYIHMQDFLHFNLRQELEQL